MDLLKRYSTLAFVVIATEVLLIYLFRPSLKETTHIPHTYEEISFTKVFSSSLLPSLTASSKVQMPNREAETTIRHGMLEQKLISLGLVNIKDRDSSIAVKLKYSTEDNFLHKNMYGDLKNCYLQKDVAYKLAKAQKRLKEKLPFYSLIIYDGVRPASIQKMMWNELQVPDKLKDKYVSSPEVGSLHNFGCAVDVSIVNENGWEMDIGTPYDYFGELGHPIAEQRMLEEGKLTWRQFENRKLLREVMTQSGFTTITTEWWHFNGSSLKIAGEKYHIVD